MIIFSSFENVSKREILKIINYVYQNKLIDL